MKDAKGHGSDTGTKGMRLIKTHVNGPHSAKVYNNPEWGEKVVKFFHNGQYQPNADSHTDDIADAHGTAQSQLQRYADQDAAKELSSGTPKSAPASVHDAMAASDNINRAIKNSPTGTISGREAHTIGRHGYNPDSVNKAIANNRTGKIGGKEASAIHRLLRGRG